MYRRLSQQFLGPKTARFEIEKKFTEEDFRMAFRFSKHFMEALYLIFSGEGSKKLSHLV
jgi:hypothetical protein